MAMCSVMPFSDIRISVIAGSLLSRKHLYDKSKNGMGVLTKIQPDGNEREEICELFPNANVTSVSMVFMIMRHMCMTIRDMQAVSRNRMKRLKS